MLSLRSVTFLLLTLFSQIAILLLMKSISNAFRALADPTRRQILQELKRGELSAGEITACFTMSGPSISRHLSILKNADLISERRVRKPKFYCLWPGQKPHLICHFLRVGFL